MTDTETAPSRGAALVAQARRPRLPIPADRRGVRDRAGISLRELASELRVTHGSVYYYERGGTPGRTIAKRYGALLEEIAEAIGYELRYEHPAAQQE